MNSQEWRNWQSGMKWTIRMEEFTVRQETREVPISLYLSQDEKWTEDFGAEYVIFLKNNYFYFYLSLFKIIVILHSKKYKTSVRSMRWKW